MRNWPKVIALGINTGEATIGVLDGYGVAIGKGVTAGLGVENGVGVAFGALFVTTTILDGVGFGSASPTTITLGLFGVWVGVGVCAESVVDEKEKNRRLKENTDLIEKPLDE